MKVEIRMSESVGTKRERLKQELNHDTRPARNNIEAGIEPRYKTGKE